MTTAFVQLWSLAHTDHSSIHSRQSHIHSFRHRGMERPAGSHHSCAVTRGLQTAPWDISVLALIPWHCYLTYKLCIRLLYLYGPSNNFIIQATLKILMMMMMMITVLVFMMFTILKGQKSFNTPSSNTITLCTYAIFKLLIIPVVICAHPLNTCCPSATCERFYRRVVSNTLLLSIGTICRMTFEPATLSMFLNVNSRLIFLTLPILPSHMSSPRLRITF